MSKAPRAVVRLAPTFGFHEHARAVEKQRRRIEPLGRETGAERQIVEHLLERAANGVAHLPMNRKACGLAVECLQGAKLEDCVRQVVELAPHADPQRARARPPALLVGDIEIQAFHGQRAAAAGWAPKAEPRRISTTIVF
jgi:hypothetical protein